jgi:hypothetical protein
MPHAYKAGSQTQLLKAQVENMREGGTFAMVAPPNPYRCPPGPYERISMVAHVLKENNPTAKILIVDPKENFSKTGPVRGWAGHVTTAAWSNLDRPRFRRRQGRSAPRQRWKSLIDGHGREGRCLQRDPGAKGRQNRRFGGSDQ